MKTLLTKNSPSARRWFGWLALATLGTLLVCPVSRRLFQTQLQMETLTFSIEIDPVAERAAAEGLPDDFPVQLARTIETPTTSLLTMFCWGKSDGSEYDPVAEAKARRQRFENLTQRFPTRPSVYANQLRWMSLGEVSLRRAEDGRLPAPAGDKRSHLNSPESLARFEAAAQRGIQLDPENAYFPMMRSVGLFVAHRDREALEAFQAAGRCTRWNEYLQDQFEGLDRLQCAAYGDRGAVQRLVNFESQICPQYARLKAASRVAIHLTRDKERAGDSEEALATRHAVMRCGGLMRAQGVSVLTTLVGIDIANIATADAGGVQDPNSILAGYTTREETAQQRSQRRSHYDIYLRSLGRGKEADWAKTEIEAGDHAKAIEVGAFAAAGGYGRNFFDLGLAWSDNLALLSAALVMLLLSASAHLAAAVHPGKLRWIWHSAYALLIVGGIGFWQWQAFAKGLHSYFLIQYMFSYLIGNGADGQAKAIVLQCAAAIVSALAPALIVGLFLTVSQVQRVPLTVGLGRGLRGLALPASVILFLFYGLSLLPTAYTETTLNHVVSQTVRNQPHYLAERSHKAWPGDPQP